MKDDKGGDTALTLFLLNDDTRQERKECTEKLEKYCQGLDTMRNTALTFLTNHELERTNTNA